MDFAARSGALKLQRDLPKRVSERRCSGKYSCSMAQGFCERCTGVRSSGACTCSGNGPCPCPPNALPSPTCVYYSQRMQELLEGVRTLFDTARDHWTVVDPTSEAELESIDEENRRYFDEVLVKHSEWGAFFNKYEDVEVGAKIGEGAQAEIFEATSLKFGTTAPLVVKVFKKGFPLESLQQQWPPQMLARVGNGECNILFHNLHGATFIKHGEFKNRFAFVMRRYWGDARNFMDRQMMLQLLHKKKHGPPFSSIQSVYKLMLASSMSLNQMHAVGILHRDVKASNVLLHGSGDGFQYSTLIDYECSVRVMGTGFWRAPEILEQLKRRVSSKDLVYTEKADVYSYGMMCYELITGRIPFEGHPFNDYGIVLSGQRPELPHDLNPWLKELITDCWKHDPSIRPTSYEVYNRIASHVDSSVMNDLVKFATC
ncbi:hypothetical protein M758_12G110700 [Ceratodon purpureus]|nr:hypothetical protein M758_12G110700 [Ceratodon purpureus]